MPFLFVSAIKRFNSIEKKKVTRGSYSNFSGNCPTKTTRIAWSIELNVQWYSSKLNIKTISTSNQFNTNLMFLFHSILCTLLKENNRQRNWRLLSSDRNVQILFWLKKNAIFRSSCFTSHRMFNSAIPSTEVEVECFLRNVYVVLRNVLYKNVIADYVYPTQIYFFYL